MYCAFDRSKFDFGKSDEVFEARGFDLGYAARVFPGYVLEQEDSRGNYREQQFESIGELMGKVFVIVYAPRGRSCRLITAWLANQADTELWHGRWD